LITSRRSASVIAARRSGQRTSTGDSRDKSTQAASEGLDLQWRPRHGRSELHMKRTACSNVLATTPRTEGVPSLSTGNHSDQSAQRTGTRGQGSPNRMLTDFRNWALSTRSFSSGSEGRAAAMSLHTQTPVNLNSSLQPLHCTVSDSVVDFEICTVRSPFATAA
jgi:hypothetical protein